MSGPRIVTSRNTSSLWRALDWVAYRDGDEESGRRGYGITEQGAIDDLLEQEAEDEE